MIKQCFVCPSCGPHVAADEDGCCASCGQDCLSGACNCVSEQAFLAEVERRAAATREEMLDECGYEDTRLPRKWLRRILGEEKP